jgi:ribonuclease HII
MEFAGVPLRVIRERIETNPSSDERRRMAEALREDPRRGARELGARMNRREEARCSELARLEKLFARREQLLRSGVRFVAGIDEVGVGPLAGPLVAASVIFASRVDLEALIGLDDSKRLTRPAREALDVAIRQQASAVCVAEVSAVEVDRLNPYQAGLLAMRKSVVALDVEPDQLLVDARTIPGLGIPQTSLVHGDAIDASIAAASIVAKVHRDAVLCRLGDQYPGYGFDRHMGYGTPEHLAALRRLGPTPAHRRSYSPVARAIAAG